MSTLVFILEVFGCFLLYHSIGVGFTSVAQHFGYISRQVTEAMMALLFWPVLLVVGLSALVWGLIVTIIQGFSDMWSHKSDESQ